MFDILFRKAVLNFYLKYKGTGIFSNIANTIEEIFNIAQSTENYKIIFDMKKYFIFFRTLFNWVNNYNSTGSIESFCKTGRPINSGKINDAIEQYIIKRFTVDKNHDIKNVRRSIKRIFNMPIKKSTIYNVLKKNKITHKRVAVDRYPYSEKERKEKHTTLRKELSIENNQYNNDNVISYDESYMSPEKLTREYGWAKSGHKAARKVDGRRYHQGKSMLMAITNKKTAAYKLIKGSIKGEQICDFIMNEVIKDQTNMTILMDNAMSHKNKKLAQEMKETGNKIVFNIPYHPQNNPIEYMNNVVKQKLKKQNIQNIEDLEERLGKIIKKIPEKIYANCFDKSYKSIAAN